MADDDMRSGTGGKGQDDSPAGQGRLPVRRRPDMVRFLVVGAFIGFVVGAVVGRYGPDAPTSTPLQEIILLGGVGVLVGLLVGAAVFLVADRRSSR